MNSITGNIHVDLDEFQLSMELDIPGNGVTGIFGHSGSGKTTLLRTMAGLERSPNTSLTVMDENWQSADKFLPTHKRPIGMVFQESSLFPHLTGQGNLDYARKRAWKHPANEGISAEQAIELLGIKSLLNRYPEQMSGGERQRFAIARALLVNPKVLLMDEPLAALDFSRKQEILPYLENLKQQLSLPIIYVTHSADEIARLADHLLVLEKGKLVASGKMPNALSQIEFPISLGDDTGAVIDGVVRGVDTQWHLTEVLFGEENPQSPIWLRQKSQPSKAKSPLQPGDKVRIRILAKDVSLALTRQEDSSILNILKGSVKKIQPSPSDGLALIQVAVSGTAVLARITLRSLDHLQLSEGDQVWVQVKSAALVN